MIQRKHILTLMLLLTGLAGVISSDGCKTAKPNQPPLVDQVITGLNIAQDVANQLGPIVQPLNPEVATTIGKVSTDLGVIVKTYTIYDSAAGQTTTNIDLLRATAGSIQTNLSDILAAIGVKNPTLVTTVRVAVLVVNTAITAVIDRLPPPTTPAAQAAHISQLGVLPSAGAADLKKAWNDEVSGKYPKAVVK